MSDEIVVIEESRILEVFQAEGGLNFAIEAVRAKVDDFAHDMTTKSSRSATSKLASQIAKLKVRLDGMGKELVTDWKTKAKLVDGNRKHLRDALDELKAEARKPLTDWENAEKDREEAHYLAIEAIKALMVNEEGASAVYATNLETAKNIELGEKWEEFAEHAKKATVEAIEFLEAALPKALKSEADQIELDNLREANEARQKQEREDALREEGASAARQEMGAETKPKPAPVRPPQDIVTIKCREAKESFMAVGFCEDDARDIVKAIRDGKVANVTISY